MRTFLLFLLACGPAPLATVADGCYELSGVVCAKDAQCNVGGGSGCVGSKTQLCCATHDCTMPVADCGNGLRACAGGPGGTAALAQSVFRDCEAAINAMTCGEVAGGLLPAACAGGLDGGN
jgi:hypothetical protein